jgi:hypothetical protein
VIDAVRGTPQAERRVSHLFGVQGHSVQIELDLQSAAVSRQARYGQTVARAPDINVDGGVLVVWPAVSERVATGVPLTATRARVNGPAYRFGDVHGSRLKRSAPP